MIGLSMPLWAEITATVLLVIAGSFALVGSLGLVKLPDPMTRLHAPTKATTLGVGGVLLASMLVAWAERGTLSWHELLIALFLFLTSPITALFIAKVHLHLKTTPQDLPAPPNPETGWAGYTVEAPARGVRDMPQGES